MTAVDQNVIKFDMSASNLSQLFLDEFHQVFQNHHAINETVLEAISTTLKDDLSNTSLGHFSHDDWEKIGRRSGAKLAEKMRTQPDLSVPEAWGEVVRDFHTEWSREFKVMRSKPKPIKPKNETEGLLGYLWIVFQAMVLVKIVILWLGAKVAEDEVSVSTKILFVLAILYMFASPFYFVWRKTRKKKSEENPDQSTN